MIGFETFIIGLIVISTFTSLATEAVKKTLTEYNKPYRANTLAGIIATVLSAAVGVCYLLVTNTAFTSQSIVYLVVMIFMSWLCAMVGYDKVIQAISQFKTNGKADE